MTRITHFSQQKESRTRSISSIVSERFTLQVSTQLPRLPFVSHSDCGHRRFARIFQNILAQVISLTLRFQSTYPIKSTKAPIDRFFQISFPSARTKSTWHKTTILGRMSVTVPLVTFDPSDENRGGKRRTKMGEEKSHYNGNDAVHLASFTQVPFYCCISPYV